MGHRLASHSITHRLLRDLEYEQKKVEISDSKNKIEHVAGIEVSGFRAPSYSIDHEVIQLLGEEKYRYDPSLFAHFANRKQLGINRVFSDPFVILPKYNLLEFPMPSIAPGGLRFHPAYAFVLSKYWHNFALNQFSKKSDYLTYLYHLTDFAEKQDISVGPRLRIYTNNQRWKTKSDFLNKTIRKVLSSHKPELVEDFVNQWPASAPALNPKLVLGVSCTHETSACITSGGKILAAVSEERISRKKLDASFPPKGAINEVIDVANIDPKEIDAVAIAGLPPSQLLSQTWDSQKQDFAEYHSFYDYIPHFCRALYRLYYFGRALQYKRLEQHLKSSYGITPKVFYVEHHEAHAWSSYICGGEYDALVVTADGVGDDVSLTVVNAEGGLLHRLYQQYYPHSFGQFYTAITQVLGFKGGRHEGKITGLAAYVDASPEVISAVEKTLIKGDEFKLNKKYYSEGILRNVKWRQLLGKKILSQKLFHQSFGGLDDLFEYRNYKQPLKKFYLNSVEKNWQMRTKG